MSSTTSSIHALATKLASQLFDEYRSNGAGELTGTGPLREAFAAFGRSAVDAAIPLEDTMAASIDVLQALFDRVGGNTTDSTSMLAAGIALAAVSRTYHDREGSATISKRTGPPPKLPWLAALHRINRAATANLELTDMLETSVRLVAETTGADGCAVFLYDEPTASLALRAAVGLSAASVGVVTVRSGMGITGRAASERRVIAATNAHAHEAFLPYPSTGEDIYLSQMSVPMLLSLGTDPERLVGVMNIMTIERRQFTEEEIAFLQTVAGELAISIENARLYTQTDARLRRKITELGTLQRVSHTIASTLDLGDVLRLIAEQAVLLMSADAAAIFRLPHRSTLSEDESSVPTIEHWVGDTRELVDEQSRAEVVRHVLESGAAQAVDIEYVDGSSRLFCLPLRSARETLGALCLRLKPGSQLTEDELGLLQAFSDSATLAIDNARLYQDARHGLETTSALLQEMHHRVRNNLQTVGALLSIHLRQAEDAPWAAHLREAVSRVQAIAAVHDLLSNESRLGGTTVDVIANHVADEAKNTLIPPGLNVSFDIGESDVAVPSRQATVLALLINELVSNAVSHGFRNRDHGTITIRSHLDNDLAVVEVSNDGAGVPAGFDPVESEGLGMRIIQRLVTSDLRGTFSIRTAEQGTVVARLTFPLATTPPPPPE